MVTPLRALSYRGGHDAWRSLIGPGKPIDTDRFFVVSPNVIGSAYGSTGPCSIDPNKGKAYGPDFPDITLVDIVRAQRALIDHLNVIRLHAIVGASFGGFQAFQWALIWLRVWSPPAAPCGRRKAESIRLRAPMVTTIITKTKASLRS